MISETLSNARSAWKYVALVFGPVLLAQVLILAYAEAGSGASADGSLPTELWLQAINFAIYAAIIFFVARKPVRAFFAGRTEAFLSESARAQKARDEAQAQKNKIASQLRELEAGAKTEIEKARVEAENLKKAMVADAEALAARLKEEAQRTVQSELALAKRALRDELLSQAVASARSELKDRMAEPDQRRLQTEFVDKMQVVAQ